MNRLGKIETAVLDFDGVMAILPPEFWIDVRIKALEEIAGKKVTTDDELYRKFVKLGEDPQIGWKEAYLRLGGDFLFFSRIVNSAEKAAYLKFDSELLETINALREIVKKIVVFSGSNYGSVVDGLNVLFNDMGTLKMIDRIVTSDLLQETTKPDLTAYQQMLKKCSINPKTAMMVDDSPAEIASAKKAGMKGVLVGNHPESVLKKIKPDLQIPNIYSLISILAGN